MEASCSNEWSNKKFSRTALPCHYKDTAQIKGNESPEKKSCSWIERFQLDVSQSRSSVENTMKASIICLVVLVAVGLKSCLSAVGVGKQPNLEEELPVRLEWVQEDLHSNQHLLAIFINIVLAIRSSFRPFTISKN